MLSGYYPAPSRQVGSDSCPELDILLVLIPQSHRKSLCGSRKMLFVCGWSFFIAWFLFMCHTPDSYENLFFGQQYISSGTPIKFISKHLSTPKSKRTPQYIPRLAQKKSVKYQLTCHLRNFERSFRKREETPTPSLSPNRSYPDTIRTLTSIFRAMKTYFMANNTLTTATTAIKFIGKHLPTPKSKRTPQYIPQLGQKISSKYQLTCPLRNFERGFGNEKRPPHPILQP
ncbi:hypothetical protein CDAR_365031 [Caerostris darwini]|uniref:Uncharacterized protein n=1 Tax=Caerostris darwini TaxID=1538125 RepID=A0AAV4S3T6_9ARAC|nr:hypothetical protein CDAR_365031 [Caerostris darwini]